MLQSGGHGNASCWLWASQPDGKTFDYTEAKLLVGATTCAAEFEVSRSFLGECAYELVFFSYWKPRMPKLRATGAEASSEPLASFTKLLHLIVSFLTEFWSVAIARE